MDDELLLYSRAQSVETDQIWEREKRESRETTPAEGVVAQYLHTVGYLSPTYLGVLALYNILSPFLGIRSINKLLSIRAQVVYLVL